MSVQLRIVIPEVSISPEDLSEAYDLFKASLKRVYQTKSGIFYNLPIRSVSIFSYNMKEKRLRVTSCLPNTEPGSFVWAHFLTSNSSKSPIPFFLL